MTQPLRKTVWQFFVKLSIHLLCDPAILLLGVYPRLMKTCVHTKTRAGMLTVAFVHSSKKLETIYLTCEWIKEKKKKAGTPMLTSILLPSTLLRGKEDACSKMVNLRCIVLSERNRTPKPTHYKILFMKHLGKAKTIGQNKDQSCQGLGVETL